MTTEPNPTEFIPVPVRERYDGWTSAKQAAFIEVLAETASVAESARRLGMSPDSAYRLRRRTGALGFATAWDRALECAVQRLADSAMDRAINGVAEPVFWRGEHVGERRRYSDRLTTFMLRRYAPARFDPRLSMARASFRDACENEAETRECEHARAAGLAMPLDLGPDDHVDGLLDALEGLENQLDCAIEDPASDAG